MTLTGHSLSDKPSVPTCLPCSAAQGNWLAQGRAAHGVVLVQRHGPCPQAYSPRQATMKLPAYNEHGALQGSSPWPPSHRQGATPLHSAPTRLKHTQAENLYGEESDRWREGERGWEGVASGATTICTYTRPNQRMQHTTPHPVGAHTRQHICKAQHMPGLRDATMQTEQRASFTSAHTHTHTHTNTHTQHHLQRERETLHTHTHVLPT